MNAYVDADHCHSHFDLETKVRIVTKHTDTRQRKCVYTAVCFFFVSDSYCGSARIKQKMK